MIFTDNSEKVLESIRLQYKTDLFTKLGVTFKKGKRLLDIGCGNGSDGTYLQRKYKIIYTGSDVYKDIDYPKTFPFKKASILKLPFKDNSYDYIFIHDVLHHVDEKKQRIKTLKHSLSELRRICKPTGLIIICEGNRYNPVSYFHIVKHLGHNHFSTKKFRQMISSVFSDDVIDFKNFELHTYPPKLSLVYRIYEKTMEMVIPKMFLSYNAAIIKKNENKNIR